jgi:hypothetical protein
MSIFRKSQSPAPVTSRRALRRDERALRQAYAGSLGPQARHELQVLSLSR